MVTTQLNWAIAPRFDHEGCLFCDIARGRKSAEVHFAWPEALAIEPSDPEVPGHLVVIPMAHVRDITEDPALSACISHRVTEVAHSMLVSKTGRGVTVHTSIESLTPQGVYHLHVNVMPLDKKEDDSGTVP